LVKAYIWGDVLGGFVGQLCCKAKIVTCLQAYSRLCHYLLNLTNEINNLGVSIDNFTPCTINCALYRHM